MASKERTWNHGISHSHFFKTLLEPRSRKFEDRQAQRDLRAFTVFGEPYASFFPLRRKPNNMFAQDIRARMEEQDQRYIKLDAQGRLTPGWKKYGAHHKERILGKMRQLRNRRESESPAESTLP